MRKVLTLLLYLAMILAGMILIIGTLLYDGRGFALVVGGFLLFLGAYLFWTDFVVRDQANHS